MIWASPWAWALAVAATLPLIAHLWSRRRPAAVLFPTLRFLRAASPISRRLRRVQDWPLLLLRLAIVGAICAAAAGPTVSVNWRQQAWRERLHRIILVDVDLPSADTARVIADLQEGAASSTVLGPAAIADILDAGTAEAGMSAARIRSELVVLWDGSRAALTATDVASVPANVGLRLMVLDRGSAGTTAPAHGTVDAAVRVEMPPAAAALGRAVQASLETLRLPAPQAPITARWSQPGAAASPAGQRPLVALPRHVLRALDDIAADPRVREAAERSVRAPDVGGGAAAAAGSMVLARAMDGAPLLRGSSDGRGLVLEFATTPRSPLTWWAIVSAREALAGMQVTSLGRWSAADVAAATRTAPQPPAPSLPAGLDTRASWGLALALLAIEQFWRARRPAASGEERPQAPRATDGVGVNDAA